MFNRFISLPDSGVETFFLWVRRQTGKSTLLGNRYPNVLWIDLLKADEFRRYASRPETLHEEIDADPLPPGRQIVIDEVQKVPALLDRIVVCREPRARRTGDGIEIMPFTSFVRRLWSGDIV